jgi:PTS system ascorbate-specific IIA component
MTAPGPLSVLLSPQAIRVGVEARDWREAVTAAGEALTAAGAADAAYTAEMIETIERLGPYAVLAPGVALPHARPSPAVRRVGLAIVTLARPVPFGHPENDPVALVIAFAAPDDRAHSQALAALAQFLAEPAHREALLAARSPADVLTVVRAFEAGVGAIGPRPDPNQPPGG